MDSVDEWREQERVLEDIKKHPVTHIHSNRARMRCCIINGKLSDVLQDAHFEYIDFGTNPTEKCDNPDGPCACGAWHNPEEMIRKFLKRQKKPSGS